MTTLRRKMKFVCTYLGLLLTLQLYTNHIQAQTNCSGKPSAGTANANPTAYCSNGAPTLTVIGASKGTGITHQWYSSANNTSFTAVSGAIDTSFTSATITSTKYFYCITTCATSSLSDTSDTVVVNISSSAITNPISSVTVNATSTNVCAGTPVTFTANVQTSTNSSTVSLPGSVLTCTQSMSSTSSCVGSGGKYANGWTSSGKYWQYRISTLNYQDIVFSTPTSSSSSGPHAGALYYSTNGTTFTFVQNYSWSSGTSCKTTGNISLPAAANNQANLYVRLIMSGASSSGGTNRVNPNAFKGKALAPTLNPSYQWKKNGINVGVNSNTYTDNSLADNDVITVVVNPGMCASPATKTSNGITIHVTPSVTPSANVSSSDTTICNGTPVTFTAAATNGGTTPAYQWKLNGANTGTNSTTYSNSTLSNNDVVTCIMTSNATCAQPAATSGDTITMVVNPAVTPLLNVSAADTTICDGVLAAFTATPTHGGTTPSYQWKLNGMNTGTNSNTYNNSSLSNNDEVTCTLTSNAGCATSLTADGDTITMVVSPVVTPSVSIASGNINICAGMPATFTATPTNGGTAPSYQWSINNTNAGTNSATFSSSSLSNNDVISCIMTSNAECATKTKDTSNNITMTVNPVLTPSVSINATNSTICAGSPVTFTATPTSGGTTPLYQWKLNGTNVGTNSTSYSNSSLSNNDVVNCIMTSNAACLTKTKDTSSNITMTVNPVLTPSVSIAATNAAICAGTSVTFTATPTNGGSTPSYQWKLNGTNTGTSNATYSNSSLSNSDVISCILTSNATCLSKTKDTSNGITMTVSPVLIPSITIATPNTTICAGTPVTFTATPTNSGTAPVYVWKKNGLNVGTNSSNYIDNALATGDVISVALTGNGTCISTTPVTSNSIAMTVHPSLNASVNISANPGNSICDGSPVTFTATPVNGGTIPAYQWKINGVNAGTNAASFMSSSLVNADMVTCELTSGATCANPSTSTSNTVTMTVLPILVPAITITANPGTIVGNGQSVTFTASVSNAGSSPTLQWQKNSTDIPGATTTSYTTNQLATDDTITCIVNANDPCAMPNEETSNQLVMNVGTGINQLERNITNVLLYPNPNRGSFVIEAGIANAKEARVEVLNILGQTIYESTIPVQNGKVKKQIQLDETHTKGVYLLRLHTEKGFKVLHFIAG